jgi:flagellin-like hook-associated protein FlgL
MTEKQWRKDAIRALMRVLDLEDPTLGQIRDAVLDAAEQGIRDDEREKIAQEVRNRRDHFIRVTGAEQNGIVALVHDDIANAIEQGEKDD